ncbi:MAG: glycosyltransferase family 2 protein [Planctomycetia bacterium]|nr:glycosyltransferase family 2 protein [Planctomycetia bacterium]
MPAPDISIVVCTQNRAEMLRGALASLYDLATSGFTYEIVVIDNGSRDHTPEVIAACAAESKKSLRGVQEPEKGIVPARNRGISESRSRWIAFFDDDQLADRGWLAELYRGANEKRCRVVGGSVHLSFPDGCGRRLDPTVRMLLGEAKLANETRPYGGRLTPGCGNLMIERSVFDQVGVFERTVDGRGEDTDLFSRIERAEITAWYVPKAIVHHLTPLERLADAYLLNLARRMGAGIAQRQTAQFSRGRFAALWLAKALRLGLIQMPQFGVASLRGDREAALGCRCLLAINASLLSAGVNAFWCRPRNANLPRGWGLLQNKPKTISP